MKSLFQEPSLLVVQINDDLVGNSGIQVPTGPGQDSWDNLN